MILKTLAVAAAFLGGACYATAASAGCDIDGQIFYLHKSDTAEQTAVTDPNGCDLHFVDTGTVDFQSASILRRPRNGTLRKLGVLEFRYRPAKGFKGDDRFALKVCGKTPVGSGCSTLVYTATVQ